MNFFCKFTNLHFLKLFRHLTLARTRSHSYTGNSVFTARIQDTNHSGSFVTFQHSHKVCNKYTNISYHNLST